jgi:hypothetical protein
MKQIPLTQGKFATVDDCDYEWAMQWKWCLLKIKNNLYAIRRLPGPGKVTKHVLMHRELAKRIGLPDSPRYDHEDTDGLNNTRQNIRPCSQSQNMVNTKKRTARKYTSRYKGVSRYARDQNWEARIFVDGRQLFLGRFESEMDAATAYSTAAKQHFGEFARSTL